VLRDGPPTSATQLGAEFDDVDLYVHERLAILASTKHGMTG
jgi:hypothetical protein